MLSKENTDLIGPYDKISVMNIAGQDEQATELKPIFSECKPRSGEAGTMYPINEWLDPNKTKADMEKTNNAFEKKLMVLEVNLQILVTYNWTIILK